jgi:hypothetical protein
VGLLLVPSIVPHWAGLLLSPVVAEVASGKTSSVKLLTFWRFRFCFILLSFSSEDSIASALAALAQDKMYSWTRNVQACQEPLIEHVVLRCQSLNDRDCYSRQHPL